jgi:hypothetical protein
MRDFHILENYDRNCEELFSLKFYFVLLMEQMINWAAIYSFSINLKKAILHIECRFRIYHSSYSQECLLSKDIE